MKIQANYPSKIFRYLSFILLAIFILVGCGKKKWPEPNLAQDQVQATILKIEQDDDQYLIYFQLKGNPSNVKQIVAQIEYRQDACKGCPFQIDEEKTLAFKSDQHNDFYLSKIRSRFKLSRIRLKVINVYPGIRITYSNVLFLPKTKEED